MVSRPLYLFSQFFEDKAIEKLLGTGINSEYLNDDKIRLLMDGIVIPNKNGILFQLKLFHSKKILSQFFIRMTISIN
jgi:hypothetical protein